MMAAGTPKAKMGLCFWLSATWIGVIVAATAAAGWLSLPDPNRIHWATMAALPGTAAENDAFTFWLGTDTIGRDILARLVYGTRVSLAVGLLAPIIGLVVGGLLGCVAGYYRGHIESIIVGLMDIVLAFPGLILLLAVSCFMGADLMHLIFTLGLLTIPAFCRVARAKTLSLTEQEFIDAARLSGCGGMTILFREVIPNVIIGVAVYALMVVAFLIMAEGALSFLGLSVPAPTPSWGGMIAEGREVLGGRPHISLIPAAMMFITVLSFSMLGDCIRTAVAHQKSQL